MSDWYLSRGDKQYGPYTREQLLQIARDGRIDKNDLLWSEELTEWTLAERVPGLIAAPGKVKREETVSVEPGMSPALASKSPATPRNKPRRPLLLAGGIAAAALAVVLGFVFLLPGLQKGTALTGALGEYGVEERQVIRGEESIPEELMVSTQETITVLTAKYLEAVIKTNAVIYADPDTISYEAWLARLDLAVAAWDEVIHCSDKLSALGDDLKQISLSHHQGTVMEWAGLLMPKAYAAEQIKFSAPNIEDLLPLDNPMQNTLYGHFADIAMDDEVRIHDPRQMSRVIMEHSDTLGDAAKSIGDFYGMDAREVRLLIHDTLRQEYTREMWKAYGHLTGETISRVAALVPAVLLTGKAIAATAVVAGPLAIIGTCALAIGAGVSFGLAAHDEAVFIAGAIKGATAEETENFLILKNNPTLDKGKKVFDWATALYSLSNFKDPDNILVAATLAQDVIGMDTTDMPEYRWDKEVALLPPGQYLIDGRPVEVGHYPGWTPIYENMGLDYDIDAWMPALAGLPGDDEDPVEHPVTPGTFAGTLSLPLGDPGAPLHMIMVPITVYLHADGRIEGGWNVSDSASDLGISSMDMLGSFTGTYADGQITASGTGTATVDLVTGGTMSDSGPFSVSGTVEGDAMYLTFFGNNVATDIVLSRQ